MLLFERAMDRANQPPWRLFSFSSSTTPAAFHEKINSVLGPKFAPFSEAETMEFVKDLQRRQELQVYEGYNGPSSIVPLNGTAARYKASPRNARPAGYGDTLS